MLERLTQAASSKLKCGFAVFSHEVKKENVQNAKETHAIQYCCEGPPTLSFASTVAERTLDIVHGWPW